MCLSQIYIHPYTANTHTRKTVERKRERGEKKKKERKKKKRKFEKFKSCHLELKLVIKQGIYLNTLRFI